MRDKIGTDGPPTVGIVLSWRWAITTMINLQIGALTGSDRHATIHAAAHVAIKMDRRIWGFSMAI